MNSVFIFYFIGLLITVFQDIKRREIDDWLNLFLFFSGVGFLFFSGDLILNYVSVVGFGIFLFIMCMISFIFYYSRFFSGGDAKLLFAMTPLLYDVIFNNAINNALIFIVCLILCGCIYSLIYSACLFFKDFNMTKKSFIVEFNRKYLKIIFIIGIVLLVVGLIDVSFVFIGVFLLLFVFLMAFAKSLENVSMKKIIFTGQLREGDWLFYDLDIGGRKFKKSWEGLSEKDVVFLKRFNKKVVIKDGIPYAPAFLLALILYYFSDYLLGIVFSQGF